MKRKKIYDAVLLLDLTSELKERLKKDAKKERVSTASFIRRILNNFFK